MLQINPEDCLVDEQIHIKISTLKSHQRITLRCETIEKNYVYDSYAYFIGDYNGKVDLSLSPSFGGSYKGIDKMGIFSSMLPAKRQMIGLKYKAENVAKPCKYKLQVYDGFVEDEEFEKPNIKNSTLKKYPITEKVIKRRFCAENVTREEISHGKVRAVLYKPQGPGPFKGVIDIYGSGGGLMEIKAPLLASHGFVSMVLPLFRYKDLPETIGEVEIEYMLEAIDYISSLPYILPGIGVLGLSWGASLVLMLASICKKITCVISISGSPLFWPFQYQGRFFPDPVELDRITILDNFGIDEKGGDISYFRLISEKMEDVPEKCLIKLEKSDAKILIINGESDLSFDPKMDLSYFKKRMEHYGKGDHVTFLSYPGAGHFLEPPYLPQTLVQYNPTTTQVVACGGEEIENSMACVHVWKEILHFLQQNTGTLDIKAKL